MIKYIFILFICFSNVHLSAQVVITVQLPASSIYLKNQLWNISLVNTGGEQADVRVEILLTDISTNQPVLSGLSRAFTLRKGVTQLNGTQAAPITYNVLNPGYNVDANPMGFLPIGLFNICYQVIGNAEHFTGKLAEECETIEIEPLSPPVLIMPFDEDSLESSRPLFIWLAPTPQVYINQLSYDLTIVEVLPTQNSADAIQQNTPIYIQQNIPFTAHPYPASAANLDTAKLYAWQVTAKNNNNPVARSEIWTFKVKGVNAETAIVFNGVSYSKLRRINDAAFTIANGKLNYEYTNELNEGAVQIKIYDVSNSRKKVSLDADTSQVHYGQNLNQYDLAGMGGFIHKHIYLFELVNGRNETWYLKFEYRQPE